MEKRRTNRARHRTTCELIIDGQSHPGVVRDLAPTGLFVQTRARPAPNSVVSLRFPATAGLSAFEIEVGVARQRNVHPRLQAEVQSGIGLEILGRPADYLAYAERALGSIKTSPVAMPVAAPAPASMAAPALAPVASSAPTFSPASSRTNPSAPKPATFSDEDRPVISPGLRKVASPVVPTRERTYRVRLIAVGQSAPRTVVVQAASAAQARAQVQSRLDDGWKITDVHAA